MTGKFRGAVSTTLGAKLVEGNGCLFIDHKAYIIHGKEALCNKVQVIPASVSPSVYVESLGHVYRGDVIRYTFKERNEYFNRYYRVSEVKSTLKFTELYRDYAIDCDMNVVRGKFTTHAGETKDISEPATLNETYTVVGNIWEKPELEKVI